MLSTLLLFATLALSIAAQETWTPQATTQGYSWTSNYDSTKQIPTCGTITFSFSPLSGVAVNGDVSILVVVDTYWVRNVAATTVATTGTVSFLADYPVGTEIVFWLIDNDGISGGSKGPYTMVGGTNSCTYYTPYDSPLDDYVDVLNGNARTMCNTITVDSITASNSSVAPPYYYYMVDPDPVSGFTSVGGGANHVTPYIIDLSTLLTPGHTVYFWIWGSKGASTPVLSFTSEEGTAACGTGGGGGGGGGSTTLPGPSTTPIPSTTSPIPSPTGTNRVINHKSTPVGAIAGGVVGGVAVIIFGLLGLLCLRRQKRQQQQNNLVPDAGGYGGRGMAPVVPTDQGEKGDVITPLPAVDYLKQEPLPMNKRYSGVAELPSHDYDK